MGSWLIWLALGFLVLLLLSTGASLSLRLPSRARLTERMESLGRREELERLLRHRVSLLLATSTLRALVLLCFFTTVILEATRRRTGVITLDSIDVWAFAAALLGMLVFGVALPYAWARHAGESLLIALLPVLHGVRLLLTPLVAPLLGLDWVVRRLAGVQHHDDQNGVEEMEQEILNVVSEGEARGVVDEEEREMIESIIELRDARVDSIMTPRTDINAVQKEVSFAELREIIHDKGHSRVPVYGDTVDDIIGVIYAKDLLQVDDPQTFTATGVMRNPIYIPESKQTRELLHEFQEGKGHMAIVLDEYGGTAGLVTIEDILEEVVGEIVDEYEEQESAPLVRIDDSTVDVDARMRIDELNDELSLELPESEDYETIGGFVFSSLGKIPQAGEECAHANVTIRVTDVGPRKINRVRMHVTREGPDDNGSA
ncbi:MAG: HlyC/CorC family transporter [bacterium]|nr:HlyC/CorC family transporter [bacterium]